ncbi:D-tyrosyl-tRNA(Tyr) deacylase [Pacificibacter maritimus]|uniref:D-aminoacyl-tRNA deacylase n=1 Tax=Pacificibacter maritimus TaxID=762213 RepID=A0A3N4V4Q0_9RHOB|nr:D-aminoacyl-tRNA deacylase [Pacificibacter maritimus]RPE72087.1 D-tyrosyl-tRNA(Tyr) deacylase [Pacificibacter maritimus]
MRAVVQRVLEASVTVDGELVGSCDQGLLILICAMRGDTEVQAQKLALKLSKLRIFQDDAGKMNLSVRDIQGSALVVSQFTLAADTKGNRPGFSTAADPETGKALYTSFAKHLAALDVPVQTGVFGADMKVALVNDGPVTIWIDTDQ